MKLGRELLNDWLERSQLTQRELARQLGVSDGYLSQVLAGKRRPKLERLIDIREATGVPVESWSDTRDGSSDQPIVATP